MLFFSSFNFQAIILFSKMKTNPLLFHGRHIFLRDPMNIEKKMESIINKGEILCFDNELFSRLKVYYQTQCYVFKMIRLLFN